MNCPCEECLLIPLCKHKKYQQLFKECEDVYGYVFGRSNTITEFSKQEGTISVVPQLCKVSETISSVKWNIDQFGALNVYGDD